MSIEEPRMTRILSQLQSIKTPVTDADIITGLDSLEIHTSPKRSATSRHSAAFFFIGFFQRLQEKLKLQYFGGTEYTKWSQHTQEYEAQNERALDDEIKMAMVISQGKGPLSATRHSLMPRRRS
eukprot:735893-Amphidinium_carterae.1